MAQLGHKDSMLHPQRPEPELYTPDAALKVDLQLSDKMLLILNTLRP